jgi:hypothetical protein
MPLSKPHRTLLLLHNNSNNISCGILQYNPRLASGLFYIFTSEDFSFKVPNIMIQVGGKRSDFRSQIRDELP